MFCFPPTLSRKTGSFDWARKTGFLSKRAKSENQLDVWSYIPSDAQMFMSMFIERKMSRPLRFYFTVRRQVMNPALIEVKGMLL